MPCITGFDGKAYYNSGTNASPTWVEIAFARDVNTTSSADKLDASDRSSKFKKYCSGQLEIETTITATYNRTEAGAAGAIEVLRDHYHNRTAVQVAIVDGPITTTGNEGYKFYANVFSNDWDQPLSDGQTVTMTFCPTYFVESSSVIEPEWFIAS